MAPFDQVSRRRFLQFGTLGAAGIGLTGQSADSTLGAASAAGVPGQGFLHKKASIKQIWDLTTVDKVQSGCGAMMNAMNAYQFSYKQSFYLAIVLRGPSAIVYALDDHMWQKYNFASKYQIFDPATPGKFAVRNVLYARRTADNGSLSPSDPKSLYADDSLQALQHRGAHISACQAALGGQAVQAVADRRAPVGMAAADVLRDLLEHLVPGATTTPSGSSLIGVAQIAGYTYATQ